MTSEVSRQNPVGLRQISGKIATVAQSQSVEKLNQAIHSFAVLQQNDESFFQTAEFDKRAIPDAAFVDSPLQYFNQPEFNQMSFSETASINQVWNKLKQHDLNFQKGIKEFLKCGMQEALSGLKLTSDPSISLPPIPIALDELLTTQKLKNPDRRQLQASLTTVNAMFSTLKKIQKDSLDLQVNMMRLVRV